MAVALDLGGTPVNIGELQAAVEDFTVAQSAEFAAEHDSQGRHTILSALNVSGAGAIAGALTLGDDLILAGEYDVELTADTHNLQKPDGRPITEAVIRLQASVGVDLTGIVPPTNTSHIRILENGGGETIELIHNSSNSDAANRFSLPGESDYLLLSGQITLLKYDPNSEIWRVLTPGSGGVRSVQRVRVEWASGAITATHPITAVDISKTVYTLLGERHVVSAGAPTIQNLAMLDLTNTTSTVVALLRASGQDAGAGPITDTHTVVQVVEYA